MNKYIKSLALSLALLTVVPVNAFNPKKTGSYSWHVFKIMLGTIILNSAFNTDVFKISDAYRKNRLSELNKANNSVSRTGEKIPDHLRIDFNPTVQREASCLGFDLGISQFTSIGTGLGLIIHGIKGIYDEYKKHKEEVVSPVSDPNENPIETNA